MSHHRITGDRKARIQALRGGYAVVDPTSPQANGLLTAAPGVSQHITPYRAKGLKAAYSGTDSYEDTIYHPTWGAVPARKLGTSTTQYGASDTPSDGFVWDTDIPAELGNHGFSFSMWLKLQPDNVNHILTDGRAIFSLGLMPGDLIDTGGLRAEIDYQNGDYRLLWQMTDHTGTAGRKNGSYYFDIDDTNYLYGWAHIGVSTVDLVNTDEPDWHYTFNGVPGDSRVTTFGGTSGSLDRINLSQSPGVLCLGCQHGEEGIIEFNGHIVDFRLYERALTPAELTEIYREGEMLYMPRDPRRIAFVSSGGGGDPDINVGEASAAFSAADPAVTLGNVSVTIDEASAAFSATEPSVSLGNVSASVGEASATFSATDPSVSIGGVNVNVGEASAAFSASDPSVTLGNVSANVGEASAAFSATDPTVDAGGNIEVNVGEASAAFTATDPSVAAGGNLNRKMLDRWMTVLVSEGHVPKLQLPPHLFYWQGFFSLGNHHRPLQQTHHSHR